MTSPAHEEEAGPQIAGLELRRRIGTGGYADVFLYRETSLDRDVAVKVVRETGLSADEEAGFVAEAHAMARLAHPHIVPVFAVGRAAHGRPYLTMPFYPEGTLHDRAREPLGVAEVLKTGVQIGSAVAFAHGAGILHRDIKPHNILRNQFGPALSDFGIAGTIADVGERVIGMSIPWSPPEVLLDAAAPGVASDVYSLAATLWHLLAGHAPFERAGDTEADLVRRIRLEPLPPLGRPDVPTTLEGLLRQSMAKDPGDRFSSMASFVHALQDVQRQQHLEPTDVVLVPGQRRPGQTVRPDRDPARRADLTRRRPVGDGPARAAEPSAAPPVGDAPVASTTAARRALPQEQARTPVVLVVLVLVMAAVLLLGLLMLALRAGGAA